MHEVRFSGLVHHILRPFFIEMMLPDLITRLLKSMPKKLSLVASSCGLLSGI